MFREGEVRIKIYAKITGKRTGSEIISKEGDRGSGEFVTLQRGANRRYSVLVGLTESRLRVSQL